MNKRYTIFDCVRYGLFEDLDEYLLTASPSDVNTSDSLGNTMLHYCASYANDYYVEKLLLKGADANIRNKYYQTPLVFMLVYMMKERFEVEQYHETIRLLVGSTDDPDLTYLYELTTPKDNEILDPVIAYISSLGNVNKTEHPESDLEI
jgi:ankyrin repeat protein